MIRFIVGTSGLAALWLLMSGIFDKPLILIFGVLSVAFCMYIAHRANVVDGDKLDYGFSNIRLISYTLWLFKEIAKSNIAVAKAILSPSLKINPKMFSIPATQRTDIGQVIYANSITLTPGTITVETENDYFYVHALDFGEDDRESLGDMNNRVAAVEVRG